MSNSRLLLVLLCWIWLVLAGKVYGQEPIVVIVHPNNSLTTLDATRLAKIYEGRWRSWQNGQAVYVINRPIHSTIRSRFYQQALHTKATTKFYQSGSPLPFKTRVVKSDRAARKFVAKIPNAIAYIHASEVDNSVKVLAIDGLRFDQAGYLLGEISHLPVLAQHVIQHTAY